ncbi:MAG: hypothetical protein JW990_11765 [Thermoleophilia bacterium]|nr:hypothetical protein [Thermoleophilia bacterium]
MSVPRSSLKVGKEPLGQGATATIWPIAGSPPMVLKEFHPRIRRNIDISALERLISFRDSLDDGPRQALDQVLCLPREVVTVKAKPVGVVLPRIPAEFTLRHKGRTVNRTLDALWLPNQAPRLGMRSVTRGEALALVYALGLTLTLAEQFGIVVGDLCERHILYSIHAGEVAVYLIDVDGAAIGGFPAALPVKGSPLWMDPRVSSGAVSAPDSASVCYAYCLAVLRTWLARPVMVRATSRPSLEPPAGTSLDQLAVAGLSQDGNRPAVAEVAGALGDYLRLHPELDGPALALTAEQWVSAPLSTMGGAAAPARMVACGLPPPPAAAFASRPAKNPGVPSSRPPRFPPPPAARKTGRGPVATTPPSQNLTFPIPPAARRSATGVQTASASATPPTAPATSATAGTQPIPAATCAFPVPPAATRPQRAAGMLPVPIQGEPPPSPESRHAVASPPPPAPAPAASGGPSRRKLRLVAAVIITALITFLIATVAFARADASDYRSAIRHLHDQCGSGDLEACDYLYVASLPGSPEQQFGDTCGQRTEGGTWCAGDPAREVLGTYGDDASLDALWNQCANGDMASCDELAGSAPAGSRYEQFGNTCGDRTAGGAQCAGTPA